MFISLKEPVYLEPCTLDHFNSLPNFNVNWTEQFIELKISGYLCLMKNETFPIGGRFQSPDFFHLKFTVTKCSNKTNPLNPWKYQCASKEVIDQKLKDEDNRIQFLFSNYLLKPEQPKKTAQVFLDALIFTIQPDKMYTTANVFVNEQTLITDESILPIKDMNQFSLPIYNNGDFRQQYSAGNFTKFCEIFIQRSTYSTTIKRSFQKIDKMISYIGGFSQIFLLISTFIKLANRLYDFDPSNQQKQSQNMYSKDNPDNQTDRIQQFQLKSGDIESAKVDLSILSAKKDDEDCSKQGETYNISKDGDIFSSKGNTNKIEEQKTQERQKSFSVDIKKIINRKDAGLMPLEDIRNIIQSRKNTFIKKSKYLMKSKLQKDQESQSNLSPTKQQNKNDDIEKSPILQNDINFQIAPLSPISIVSDRNFQSIDRINLIQSLNQFKDEIEQKQTSPPIIQKQESINNFKQNNGQENTDTSKNNASPLVKFQKKLFSFYQQKGQQNTDNNIVIPSRSTSKFGTLVSPDPLNQKDIESNNSLFKGYQKKIFEGLGFNDAKTFLEKELEFIIKRDRSLKITYHYFINILTCGKFCNTNEVKLLSKASDLVRKDLDIFNVLDKIKEVDKLKKLLLTQEEQVLFNFFPKPVIFSRDQYVLPSRQKMEETKTTQKQVTSKLKLNKTSKKFNINLNNIAIISKAMTAFKRNLKKNRISEYQTLFNCYDKITQRQSESQ